jgi:hypothetical protein
MAVQRDTDILTVHFRFFCIFCSDDKIGCTTHYAKTTFSYTATIEK